MIDVLITTITTIIGGVITGLILRWIERHEKTA